MRPPRASDARDRLLTWTLLLFPKVIDSEVEEQSSRTPVRNVCQAVWSSWQRSRVSPRRCRQPLRARGRAPHRARRACLPRPSTGEAASAHFRLCSEMPLTGADTVTVPGLVAGWGELHARGPALAWTARSPRRWSARCLPAAACCPPRTSERFVPSRWAEKPGIKREMSRTATVAMGGVRLAVEALDQLPGTGRPARPSSCGRLRGGLPLLSGRERVRRRGGPHSPAPPRTSCRSPSTLLAVVHQFLPHMIERRSGAILTRARRGHHSGLRHRRRARRIRGPRGDRRARGTPRARRGALRQPLARHRDDQAGCRHDSGGPPGRASTRCTP